MKSRKEFKSLGDFRKHRLTEQYVKVIGEFRKSVERDGRITFDCFIKEVKVSELDKIKLEEVMLLVRRGTHLITTRNPYTGLFIPDPRSLEKLINKVVKRVRGKLQ